MRFLIPGWFENRGIAGFFASSKCRQGKKGGSLIGLLIFFTLLIYFQEGKWMFKEKWAKILAKASFQASVSRLTDRR